MPGKNRFARKCAAVLFAAVTICLTATAQAAEFGPVDYEIYHGDLNSDGCDDLYLKAKSRFIILAGDVDTPIKIPPAGISYKLLSSNSGGCGYSGNLVADDPETVNVATLSEGYRHLSGDFNGDGLADTLLQAPNGNLPSISVVGSATTPSVLQVFDGSNGPLVHQGVGVVSLIDHNGDGRDDILISGSLYLANSSGMISISSGYFVLTSTLQDKGALAGKFTVGRDGAARYKIPIEAPPGINGMAPKLSFDYNSNGGDGALGKRWRIGGLSEIKRCKSTLARDASVTQSGGTLQQTGEIGRYSSQANINSLDKMFCLDGQRLIAINGSYGGNGTEYRTENEKYLRIISNGSAGGGPQSFTVYQKDGRVIQYGVDTAASRASGQGTKFSWSINRITDIAGNEINFNYAITNGEQTLVSVNYTKNGATDLNHRVEFVYSSSYRPDPVMGYVGDTPVNNLHRLEAVKVKAAGNFVRKYVVSYQNNSNDSLNASRIDSIGLCFDDIEFDCATPVSFTWTQYPASPLTSITDTEGVLTPISQYLADVNGDGLTDIVRNEGDIKVLLSVGDGTFQNEQVWKTDSELDAVAGNRTVHIGDLNADGMADLMVRKNLTVHYQNGQLVDNGFGGYYLLLANGSGFGNAQLYFARADVDPYKGQPNFYDLNGDSLPEAFSLYENNNEYVSLNTGAGFTNRASWLNSSELTNLSRRLRDVNGDGLSDMLKLSSSGYLDGIKVAFNKGNGQDFTNFITLQSLNTSYTIDVTYFTDVNGDGLQDHVFRYADYNNPPSGIWVSLNTGTGFSAPERWIDDYENCTECTFEKRTDIPYLPNSYGRIRLVDINADRKADVLVMGTDGLYVSLSTGVAPSTSGVAKTGFLPKQRIITFDVNSSYDFTSILGDINGDGLIDLFHKSFTGREMHLNRYPTQHIHEIHEGFNRELIIDYRSLANSNGAYTKGQSSATTVASVTGDTAFEESDSSAFAMRVSRAQYVVGEYHASNGVGGNVNTYRYHYTGLSQHLSGWGSLGFSAIQRDTLVNGVVVKRILSEYSQDHSGSYNLAGKLLKQTAYAGDAQSVLTKVSETVNHWKVKTHSDDTDASGHNSPHFFPYIESSTTYSYGLNGEDQFAETRYNLDYAAQAPAVCLAPGQAPTVAVGNGNAFDAYGGLEQSVTVRCDGTDNYISGTKRTYQNMNTASQWVLNLPTTESLTHTVPADTNNRERSFSYNALGQLQQVVIEPNHSTLRLTTDYTYNAFGSVNSVVESWPGVANGMNGLGSRTTTMVETFAGNGERTVVTTNPLNHVTTTVYDAVHGLEKSLTDSNGVLTARSYDYLGRPVAETLSGAGVPSITSEFKYRLCESAGSCNGDAAPQAYHFVYQKTDGQPAVRLFYDKLDRAVGQRNASLNGGPVFQYTEYDEQGRVHRVSEPNSGSASYWTTTLYDNLNRITQISYPNGNFISHSYDGRERVQTNGLNQTSSQYTNALGQVVKVIDHNGTPTDYTYYAFGELRTTKVNNSATTLITVNYDKLGNKTSITDPDLGYRQFKVNALGLVYQEIDAKNQVTDITFDALGRMITRHEHGAGSSNQWIYDAAVNGKGLLAMVSGTDTGNRTFTESYQYNGLQQLAAVSTTVAGVQYDTQYQYDSANRLAGIVYPSGTENFAVSYAYNNYEHKNKISNTNSGEVLWQANAADVRGNITNVTLAGGLYTTQRTYDTPSGRIEQINTDNNTGTRLQEQTFDFDLLGNLTQRLDGVKNTTENFCYDSLNRLTHQALNTSCTAGINNQFNYDALGNIASKAGVGSYAYMTTGSRPHAVTAVDGAAYSYDANGDMLTGAGRTVAYSVFGKPTHMARGSNSVAIVYGPGRQRIERTDTRAGSTTTTTYVQGLFEKVVDATLTQYKFYVDDVAIHTQLVNTVGEEDRYTAYPLRDHMGSVVGQLTLTGVLEEDLAYDAWGQRLQAGQGSAPVDDSFEPLVTPRGFTGHEHLDSVGLIHMNGRVYDPALGRFMSADPLIQSPYNSQSFNRYSYVFNNPLSFVDPSGYEMEEVVTTARITNSGSEWINIGVVHYTPNLFDMDIIRVLGVDQWFAMVGELEEYSSEYNNIEDREDFRDLFAGYYERRNISRAYDYVGFASGYLSVRLVAKSIGKGGAQLVREGIEAGERVLTEGVAQGVTSGTESAANAARLRGQLAGQEIAGGHAFEKHVLQQGEFRGLGIRTREQFANHIENVVNNPTATRQLSGGRTAYWDDASNTVVIRNPRAADGGTAFQPVNGRAYFDGLR